MSRQQGIDQALRRFGPQPSLADPSQTEVSNRHDGRDGGIAEARRRFGPQPEDGDHDPGPELNPPAGPTVVSRSLINQLITDGALNPHTGQARRNYS